MTAGLVVVWPASPRGAGPLSAKRAGVWGTPCCALPPPHSTSGGWSGRSIDTVCKQSHFGVLRTCLGSPEQNPTKCHA